MACARTSNQRTGLKHAILAMSLTACPGIAGATDVAATPADRPPLAYPESAGQAGGNVILRFDIGTDGHVHAPKIVRSTPPGVFDAAALQGVALWLYHPRLHDGRPMVQAGQTVSVTFEPPPLNVEPSFRPTLDYPRAAYAAHQEGQVTIGYDTTVLGQTANVHVMKAEPVGIFEEAAIRYVQDWRFNEAPAGQPIAHRFTNVVFRLADAQMAPIADRPARPEYPPNAQRRGIMGDCHVEYWIEENGTTSDAHILYWVPAGYFEDATLLAMKHATYKPEPVPALNRRRIHRTNIEFRFEGVSGAAAQYLKPGQWVKLRYTLTRNGRASDIEVIGKSDALLREGPAVQQLRATAFSPATENGHAVARAGSIIVITGH